MPYALVHVLAAVDGDVGAGNERRLLGAQVDDEAGDLVGLAQAPDRDLRQDFGIENFLRDRRHHLRADVAGRDGVDGDALARDFQRQRLGEAVDAGLRRRVVGLAEGALLPVHRRDVDDGATVATYQTVHHLLVHFYALSAVSLHHRFPAGLVHLL